MAKEGSGKMEESLSLLSKAINGLVDELANAREKNNESSKQLMGLRNDINHQVNELRQRMDSRFELTNSQFNEVRKDIGKRFSTLSWIITTWLALLTILVAVLQFIKF